MSGTLDEISVAIGSLQAGMRNVEKTLEHILVEIKGNQDENAKRLDPIERDVESLKNFRSRMYGIAATVSLIGSVAGSYLSNITKRL